MHVAGEVKARTSEAETDMTRTSQVNDDTLRGETQGDAAKSSSPAAAAAVNEPPSSVVTGDSDHQGSENGLQRARDDGSSTMLDDSPVRPSRSSEDTREVIEKSEGGGVSCVRDLINEAIEKTLQDPVEQSRSVTPPPSLSGQ